MAKLLETEFKNNSITWDSGVSFKRLNPQPIDIDSIFFNIEDAQQYAETGKNAYVGQQIIVINSEQKTVDLYIIKNEEGELATINSNIEIVNDESSPIILNYKRDGQNYKFSANIKETSISNDLIEQEAITTNKISKEAVTTEKIANSAITEDKIALKAVTTERIADQAIGGQQLQAWAVSGGNIMNETIKPEHLDKIEFETLLNINGAGGIREDYIWDGAITTYKVADEAITAQQLANGSIMEEKIDVGAVTTEKIANETITNEKVANSGINSDKIIVEDNLKLSDWIEKNEIIKLKFRAMTGIVLNNSPTLLICNNQPLIRALQNDIGAGKYQVLNCVLTVDNNVITSEYLETLKKAMNIKVFPSYTTTSGGIGMGEYGTNTGLGCYFCFLSEDDNTSEPIYLNSPIILELLIQKNK